MLDIGSIAPEFEAPCFDPQDESRRMLRLSDYRGKPVALSFYPKDFTPGCTRQACAVRDAGAVLAGLGVTVVGISNDTVEQHRAFAAKHGLKNPLVSDPGGSQGVRALYRVPRSFLGLLPGRVTYVVDKNGVISAAFNSQVNIGGHMQAILQAVRS